MDKKYSLMEMAIGFLVGSAALYALSWIILRAKKGAVAASATMPKLQHTGIVQPPKTKNDTGDCCGKQRLITETQW